MSFDDGFILGLSLGGGGGGSGYVNNDPDYALYKALPEPAANQAVILLRIANCTEKGYVSVHFDPEIPTENISDYGEGFVDWGDGASDGIGAKFSGSHAYSTTGDYIITITDNSGGKIESVCCRKWRNYGYPIAMKVGASLVYDDYLGGKTINSSSNFKYIQFASDYIWENGFVFNGAPALTRIDFLVNAKPSKLANYQFYNCNALDFENLLHLISDVTEIGNDALNNCYNLKKLNLPKCVKVGDRSIYQCHSLTDVNLPLCTEIGNYGLAYNYSMNKVTLSDGCTFGSSAFNYCNCLIPTPNGIYPN